MKKISLIFLVLYAMLGQSQFTVTPGTNVAQNIDWIKYTGQKNSVTNAPTAIDANNSMYLTGFTGISSGAYDILTQKRDSLGTVVFTSAYDNGSYDKGNAIKIFGNDTYVTGVSYGNGTTGLDYITLKYNQVGAQIASARYDAGTGTGGTDEAVDIKVDLYGAVYVTGKSMNTSGNYDIVTMKYNSSLTLLWVHNYNGSANSNDTPAGLAVSSNGAAVFITGSCTNASGNTDIVTYRLNSSNGALTWSTITNGSGSNSNDRANGIILSGANVVIAGEIKNTNVDQTTIKYNGTTGSIIFRTDYDYLSYSNRGAALVRDSTGNIATVGTVFNGSTYEYHTVLLDSTGTQIFVNKEATGLSSLLVDPRIACDTLAHHFYCVGEKMKTSRDIFVYQISPGGNTSWNVVIDGTGFSEVDAGTSISVNGIGVVYVGAQSKNSSANYDYTSIKISQTPVYFPPDPSAMSGEKPSVSYLFYENKGQITRSDTMKVASDILFSTMYNYPLTYYKPDRISYKFYRYGDVIPGNDTVQRIDISMVNANKFATANPFSPNHGTSCFMQSDLPEFALGVKSYERYFIPNIWPSIDLHYYSNSKGMKMYYVLKPGANVNDIMWRIQGATSSTIVGNNLNINSFRGGVVFDQPNVYTVDWSGYPVTLTTTATWTTQAGGTYKLNVSSYNTAWPLIIEIDNGNGIVSSPSNVDNLSNCTYYGGFEDDGIKAVDLDNSTGLYAVLGETKTTAAQNSFPVASGQTLTASSQTLSNGRYLTLVLFDTFNGQRIAANTYGISGIGMGPLNLTLRGNYITVVGNRTVKNTALLNNLPGLIASPPLVMTPGTYTNSQGPGYAIQFQFVGTNLGMAFMPWYTNLNGFASDIAHTPDRKHIYITSSLNNVYTTNTMTQTGSYNNNSAMILGSYNFQISKFDSMGVRKWSTIWPAVNSVNPRLNQFTTQNNASVLTLKQDDYLKCKIACDNTGFYLAGETDAPGLPVFSKYSSPMQATHSGSVDAFFARFNKRDSLVYSTYVGGSNVEAYTDIAVSGLKEAVMIGFSNSQSNQKITTLPGGTAYTDTTITNGNAKMLITKFDTTGIKLWSSYYGTNNSNADIVGWAVASDKASKVFITGKDLGSFTFPAVNNNLYYNTTRTGTEAFMLCLNNSNNAPAWNTYFGGKYADNGLGLAYSSTKNKLYLVGMTSSSYSVTNESPSFPIKQDLISLVAYYQPDHNGTPNYQWSVADGFIASFSTFSIVGLQEYYNDKATEDIFKLFPNPTQDACNIAFKQGINYPVTIEVFNQMGQLVATHTRDEIVAYSLINLNTSNLVSGMYVVKITGGEKSYSKKLIVAR